MSDLLSHLEALRQAVEGDDSTFDNREMRRHEREYDAALRNAAPALIAVARAAEVVSREFSDIHNYPEGEDLSNALARLTDPEAPDA